MATVHTEYGPGRIIERETVRGRTRCKVAGEGFEVWIDQAKLGGLDDYDEYNDSADDRDGYEEDVHDLRHRLRADDGYGYGYGDDDPARYSSRTASWDNEDEFFGGDPNTHTRIRDLHELREQLRAPEEMDDDDPARYSRRQAWAPLDRDNSTELPYNPDPQHEAVGTPGDDGSSTIQPIHHIEADERLRPADSVSFEEGEDDGSPAPSADLFARAGSRQGSESRQEWERYLEDRETDKHLSDTSQYFDPKPRDSSRLEKRAFLPAYIFTKNHDRIQKVLHRALGPQKGQIAFMGLKGRVYGGAYGDVVQGVNSAASQAADWASPGGPAGGYGQMIHNAGVHLSGPEVALLAPLLRTIVPRAVSGLVGGGGDESGDQDYGPGEGYGDMIQASKSLSELFPPSTWDEHDRSENMYAPDGSTWDEHDERHPREHEGSHRPSGLSDRYIDVTADFNYHDDPVAQFRHDPDAYINRVGHLKDAGLDPRFAEYMDLVEADSGIRTAAWKDVRKKAMRLKREGHVTVKDMSPGSIMASVVGDHGTYDVVVLKGASINGVTSSQIANWHCDCEWGKWAFRRKYTYVGRLCSHAYASYLTMQSAAMKGQPRRTKRGPADTIIVKRPGREQYLPTFTYAAGLRTADALQNGPERLTPELVVNDADDAHIFLDVGEDERDDTGPGDVVSDRDIVHFARLMRHCEAAERPYPRRLVAFLSRYSGCADDAGDDTPADHEAHDADDANEYLDVLRADADRGQEGDFGSMADRVDEIQDAVGEARAHGADADRFVATVRRLAAGEDDDEDGDGGTTTTTTPGDPADNIRADDEGRAPITGLPGMGALPNGGALQKAFENRGYSFGPNGPTFSGRPVNQNAAPGAVTQAPAANPGGGGGGAAQGGAGGWKAPPGGTKGPVADGGVAGAENGNNAAIIGDTYTVQQGDTATDIAQRAYGDMNRYKEIADANNITDVDFGFKPGQEIKLNDAKGNGNVRGDVTNPAGGGSDKNMATPDAGPAAAVPAAPAPAPAQPAQTDATKPATIASRRTARDWLRWAGAGHDHSGDGAASPSATDTAAGAEPATATTSPGAAPATNPATGGLAPDVEDDTLDPDDPTQVAEQQQAMPGQQPLNTTPPTTGLGLDGGMGMGMGMGGAADMISTGVGAASNIASGIGGVLPGIGDAVSGIASGLGSIFSSKQDFDDWARYAYPAGGGDDFDPETLPHIPFAGSGSPGPLEYTTSEEYADEARAKMDDVTDLGEGDLSTPMGDWQKQGSHDDDDSDIVRSFQANLGNTALGADAGGGSGRFDDIAGAAAGFLRTAGRNYSLSEQSELIREGDKGGAGNLGDLDLRGTHYEDMTTLGW